MTYGIPLESHKKFIREWFKFKKKEQGIFPKPKP